MENKGKVLVIHPEKCTGCRLCELVCAVKHDGASNPARSRIRIMKWEMEGTYIPISCQQCQDAPCMNVCPAGAIFRNEELDTVEIDQTRCIGCRTCVAVCPFGAMSYNTTDKKVFKCDLCDGDPQCVRFCDIGCVEFLDAGDVSILKKKEAAAKLISASQKASQL